MRLKHRSNIILYSILICVAVVFDSCVALYANYAMSHDIPNPWWGISSGYYAYDPRTQTPNPEIIAYPPEKVVQAFLTDYITLGGTYPCIANLADYEKEDIQSDDPVLQGQPCSVQRPVAQIEITQVTVGERGFESGYKGTVTYTVHYQDGEILTHTMFIDPYKWSYYTFAHVHLTCWETAEWESINSDDRSFYPDVVAKWPRGSGHYSDQGPVCQP